MDLTEKKLKQLYDICIELMQVHPDYQFYKKVRIIHPVTNSYGQTCFIERWKGRQNDKSSWPFMEIEIPIQSLTMRLKGSIIRLNIGLERRNKTK